MTIRVTGMVTLLDGSGQRSEFLSWAKNVSANNAEPLTVQVANGATAVLWDPTGDGLDKLADADFILIYSDQDVWIEFTADEDGADHTFVMELAAGVPFILGSDDSLKSPADLSGSADVIDKIRVKNDSGSAANVRLLIAT